MAGAVEVQVGDWLIETTTEYGPRITGARRADSPGFLATLPTDVKIEVGGGDPYVFHGGHRLWAAPERPSVTYASDSHVVDVNSSEDGVVITAQPDAANVGKTLEVRADGSSLLVEHRLCNGGSTRMDVSAWGITQLRLGGTALLASGEPGDPDGLQADRSMSIWPYTSLADPRIRWTNRVVVIDATPGPRLKLGAGPEPGSLGYFLDGFLFSKQVAGALEGAYPDRGAVGQVFVGDDFCELESLGPIKTLSPGETTSTTERWSMRPAESVEHSIALLFPEPPR